MPHALIKHNRDVRAEADFTATNLSASALSTPRVGVNGEKDRTRHRRDARPGDPDESAGLHSIGSAVAR